MAKNYTFAEAVKIINEGTDLEALVDIGRRYPVLLHKVTKVCAKAGDEFVELMGFMPEYLTANKVNTAIKGQATGGDGSAKDDEDEDTGSEKDEATGGDEAKDYESMSAKQLWEILKKAGKHKTAKSTKKADLVAACKAMDAGEEPEDEDDGRDDEDAGKESNPYDGKSAVDLYKECKKRGLKADIKKPAKYYADLLVKDDAAKAKDEDAGDDDGDDWDEDESKDAGKKDKGAKAGKAEKAKDTKKPVKKDDDDGDDWDI